MRTTKIMTIVSVAISAGILALMVYNAVKERQEEKEVESFKIEE